MLYLLCASMGHASSDAHLSRRVQQFQAAAVHLEQRQGEALHVQRRHERPHVQPLHRHLRIAFSKDTADILYTSSTKTKIIPDLHAFKAGAPADISSAPHVSLLLILRN